MASYPGNQSNYYGPRGGGELGQGRVWGPQMGMANGPPPMGPMNGPGYSNMYNMGPNMPQGMPTQQHQMDGSYGSNMNQYAGQGPGMGHQQRAAIPSGQGSQPPGAPPIIQSSPGPGAPGYPPGLQGPHEAMGPPSMPQQAPGPPGGMMSQGPGPPPAYNQNMNMPFNGDQSGNQSGIGNQGGISSGGVNRCIHRMTCQRDHHQGQCTRIYAINRRIHNRLQTVYCRWHHQTTTVLLQGIDTLYHHKDNREALCTTHS